MPNTNDRRDDDKERIAETAHDTETPSHQRADFNDPLPGGDPTAPGAPHEPGGEAFEQSAQVNPETESLGRQRQGRSID